MAKGLLAEWRKGMVSRGLAAALLLAVPVGVAAAIGFEGSIGGLGEGLDSLTSGPGATQAGPGAGTDPIDAAITALATTPGAGGPSGGGNGDGSGGGGVDDGGGAPGSGGPGGAPNPAPGDGLPDTPAGDVDVPDVPSINPPNGNPVGDLIDQLGLPR
jgi:hypothetical protein